MSNRDDPPKISSPGWFANWWNRDWLPWVRRNRVVKTVDFRQTPDGLIFQRQETGDGFKPQFTVSVRRNGARNRIFVKAGTVRFQKHKSGTDMDKILDQYEDIIPTIDGTSLDSTPRPFIDAPGSLDSGTVDIVIPLDANHPVENSTAINGGPSEFFEHDWNPSRSETYIDYFATAADKDTDANLYFTLYDFGATLKQVWEGSIILSEFLTYDVS